MRKNLLIVLVFGISLGVFTSFGQTYLPDPFTQLANSYSVWLLFAFACGTLINKYRWAIISGAIIQYIALASYYILLHIRFADAGFNVSSNIIWLLGGTLVGPIAGLCGKLYSDRTKYSNYALSFIVALPLSESLYNFIQLKYIGEGIVFLLLASITSVLLLRNYNNRRSVVLPLILMTVLAYIGYAFVLVQIFN